MLALDSYSGPDEDLKTLYEQRAISNVMESNTKECK